MTAFSDYLAVAVLDHILQGGDHLFVPPEEIYIGLHNQDPGQEGVGEIEVERQRCTFTLATPQGATNTAPLVWPVLPSTTIQYISVWDAPVGGNLLLSGKLSRSKTVNDGDPFSLKVGKLRILA